MALPAIGSLGSLLARGGTAIGTRIGSSTAATAGAGAAGGMLVDDIPLVGSTLYPTEGNSGLGGSMNMLTLLALLFALGMLLDVQIGD